MFDVVSFDSLFFSQLFILAAAHFLAVASPGPDLAVVVKQSIRYGKRNAIITSIGIGSAILVHVAYSAVGIGLLIKNSPLLFDILKYACAAYLAFIGYKSLRVKASEPEQFNQQVRADEQSGRKAFSLGFITNVLNPKATLFFLSIFSVVVSHDTPSLWLGTYAIYLSLATMTWFCFVSLVLSKAAVRNKFLTMGHYFDWVMGVVLIGLAIKVAFSSL